jgi:hypothetical protein
MARKQRPFNPGALKRYAVPETCVLQRVCAAAIRAADEFLLALQEELAEALAEGVILIERQDVTIL